MISLPQASYQLHQLHQQNQDYQPQYQYPRNTTNPTTVNNTSNVNHSNFTAPLATLTSTNLSALAQQGGLPIDHMQSTTWGSVAQYANNDNKLGRHSHHRESSLSSLGSAGPASPFNPNISNPHIAINDSVGDDLSEMHANENYYQLAKSGGNPYTGYHNLDQTLPDMAYPLTISGPPNSKPRFDHRSNLLPAPELSTGSQSRPPSVASSITGDSPATPTTGHDEPIERRSKGMRRRAPQGFSNNSHIPYLDGYGNIPKLDRTMTDIYSDELYSPNFAITNTSPSHSQSRMQTHSPTSDIFSQRLNAANNQHLSANHSPNPSVSRGRSPFGLPNGGYPSSTHTMSMAGAMQGKTMQDSQYMQQQVSRGRLDEPETPKTISPKDALLDFNDNDPTAHDFPLFASQPGSLEMDSLAKSMVQPNVGQPFMNGSQQSEQFDYMAASMGPSMHLPQQYPFISRSGHLNSTSPPRLSSSPSSASAGSTPGRLSRPMGVGADSGTYTCTYHGCTLRFETPALLQKHKREGHRQAHGLVGPRGHELGGMTSSMLNSQAGPHRCDRINPSTGKPCSTIFSRPYDLTRHEDTIHNARKQKVRCDLCTEEKTFSRADALTRHYRVCHPDMELPGKYRRRGGM